MKEAKPTYVLSLDGDELAKKVASVRLSSTLDEPAELRVQTAFDPKSAIALNAATLPEKASLRVYDRGVFQGTLMEASRVDGGLLELVYVDNSYKLSRINESDFFKGITLEDYLKRMAEMAGMSARFEGSFGSQLPAFNVVGSSMLGHLQKMSYPYGFHFHARSFANEMLFIRLNRFADERELDVLAGAKTVTTTAGHDSRRVYKSSEVRFFDSSTQRSEKKEFSQQEIYEPLGYLKTSQSFDRRVKRNNPAGREERMATQAKQFEESKDLLANELSKHALSQGRLSIDTWSLPALPGDKLTIKKAPDADADGSYLVKGISIEIASSQPMVKMQLARG